MNTRMRCLHSEVWVFLSDYRCNSSLNPIPGHQAEAESSRKMNIEAVNPKITLSVDGRCSVSGACVTVQGGMSGRGLDRHFVPSCFLSFYASFPETP